MSAKHPPRRHLARRLGVLAVFVLIAAVIGLMVWQMSAGTKSTKKQNVQQISLIKPPPPPPPPKPPEQKPPEVKKEEVKIEEQKVEQPKDAPQPQEARPLGIDADGAAGSDGFGLAANRGGRDITTIGSTAGGGNRQGYYAGVVSRHIQDHLQRDKRLRGQEYRAVVNVWFREDGSVQRWELVGSSGKPDTDQFITAALAELPALKEAMPADIPQPVKLRVTSRI